MKTELVKSEPRIFHLLLSLSLEFLSSEEEFVHGFVNPVSQIATVGSSVNISCASLNRVRWSKNGLHITEPVHYIGNVLSIKNVALISSGKYSCHGLLVENGTLQPFTEDSELKVGGMKKKKI